MRLRVVAQFSERVVYLIMRFSLDYTFSCNKTEEFHINTCIQRYSGPMNSQKWIDNLSAKTHTRKVELRFCVLYAVDATSEAKDQDWLRETRSNRFMRNVNLMCTNKV